MFEIGDRVRHTNIFGIGTVVKQERMEGPNYWNDLGPPTHFHVLWDQDEYRSLHAAIYLTKVTPVEELAAIGEVSGCLR